MLNEVCNSFYQLANKVLEILRKSESPTNLKLVAIDFFNIKFTERDSDFFQKLRLFPLLLDIDQQYESLSFVSWTSFQLFAIQTLSFPSKQLSEDIFQLLFTRLANAEKVLLCQESQRKNLSKKMLISAVFNSMNEILLF